MIANTQTINTEKDQITLPVPEGAANEFSKDAQRFSDEHGIRGYVEAAMQAAMETFGRGRQVGAALKKDEYGDCYVDVHVTLIDEEPEAEAQKYSDCVEKWAPLVPAHLGGMIQLSSSWAS